jgi:hypothetical protein
VWTLNTVEQLGALHWLLSHLTSPCICLYLALHVPHEGRLAWAQCARLHRRVSCTAAMQELKNSMTRWFVGVFLPGCSSLPSLWHDANSKALLLVSSVPECLVRLRVGCVRCCNCSHVPSTGHIVTLVVLHVSSRLEQHDDSLRPTLAPTSCLLCLLSEWVPLSDLNQQHRQPARLQESKDRAAGEIRRVADRVD